LETTSRYQQTEKHKKDESPEVSLQEQADNHSFNLRPRHRCGLNHLPALGRASPHPSLHQLQWCQSLIHGGRQLHNLHHLLGILSYVHIGVAWRGRGQMINNLNAENGLYSTLLLSLRPITECHAKVITSYGIFTVLISHAD